MFAVEMTHRDPSPPFATGSARGLICARTPGEHDPGRRHWLGRRLHRSRSESVPGRQSRRHPGEGGEPALSPSKPASSPVPSCSKLRRSPLAPAPIRSWEEIDALQLGFGEGPCLDAIEHTLPCYAAELGSDTRWPAFGPAAASLGIRSLLSLPMPANGTWGAISLYARYPQAFGVIDRARGLPLASMTGFACFTARSHEDEERRAENLHAALVTNELIGQEPGPADLDRTGADHRGPGLPRLAPGLRAPQCQATRGLVDTGERPDTGASLPSVT